MNLRIKKKKIFSGLLITLTFLVLFKNNVSGFEFDRKAKTVFNRVLISGSVAELSLTLTITGLFKVYLQGTSMNVGVIISGDFEEIRKQLPVLIKKKIDRQEACGNRVSTSNVEINPNGPAIEGFATIHFEHWQCLKFDSLKLNRQVKLMDEIAKVRITASSKIVGKRKPIFYANVASTKLERPNPIAERLLRKFLNQLVKPEKTYELSPKHFYPVVPKEFRHHLVLKSTKFLTSKQGNLLLTLSGRFSIPIDQAQGVCQRLYSKAACS